MLLFSSFRCLSSFGRSGSLRLIILRGKLLVSANFGLMLARVPLRRPSAVRQAHLIRIVSINPPRLLAIVFVLDFLVVFVEGTRFSQERLETHAVPASLPYQQAEKYLNCRTFNCLLYRKLSAAGGTLWSSFFIFANDIFFCCVCGAQL